MSTIRTPLALNTPFSLQTKFIAASVSVLVEQCHGANVQAGWWTNAEAVTRAKATGLIDVTSDSFKSSRNVPELLMLAVSELSEAMEGDRKDLMDDKLPHRKMLEVELADALIRICDLAGAKGYDLGGAVAEKMSFNASRLDHTLAHRAGENGKKY